MTLTGNARRRIRPLTAFCAILFSYVGCSSKTPPATKPVEPELPAVQALPRQSLRGLNIQLKQDPNSGTDQPEWMDLSLIEPDRIAFADSFSGMSGYKCRLSNDGKYAEGLTLQSRKLDVHSSSDATGDYSVCMFEDTKSVGADGKPGVLAVSWDVVPKALGYCAFVYAGQAEGNGFNVAPITMATTARDLSGIQFRYRCKATNTMSSSNINLHFDFRLGFEGEHVFENRLDLGRVIVTQEWQSHVVDLGEAPNVNQFLNSIAQFRFNPLKLNVSHVGSVNQFQPGDTLLIDDLELIVPKRLENLLKSTRSMRTPWIPSSEIDPTHIVFADSFSDVGGGMLQVSSGVWTNKSTSRDVSIFVDPQLLGDCTLEVLEDAESLGPNGQPGVLAISWAQTPEKMNYSGFTYMGSRLGPRFDIEKVKTATSSDDLDGVFVRFQCKASYGQSDQSKVVTVGFRIEPDGGGQYASRLEFENISLSDEWTEYQCELGRGRNLENFLRTVRSQPDAGLRLIWGQVGGIELYQSGDTIQIDEIEVVVLPASMKNQDKSSVN